jgi:hypothetical protein
VSSKKVKDSLNIFEQAKDHLQRSKRRATSTQLVKTRATIRHRTFHDAISSVRRKNRRYRVG